MVSQELDLALGLAPGPQVAHGDSVVGPPFIFDGLHDDLDRHYPTVC
ncbi:hypothetical protein OFEAOIEE_LOCUS5224 [Methylorubrum extorquens]